MNVREQAPTDNPAVVHRRRTILATFAAMLANPKCSAAEFQFPRHVIGANTAISGYGLFDAIDLLRQLGFRTIEMQNLVGDPKPIPGQFPGFRLERTNPDDQERIREALVGFDLVTTHLPYQGLEYFAPASEEARFAVETIERSLEATAFLGAKLAVIHPKAGPGMNLAETWPLMIQRFRRWGDIATAGGFRLVLETGYPTSADDFVKLVYEIGHDSVGACIDVGHQARFDELTKVKPEDRGTPEGIRAYNDLNLELVERLGPKLIHLHVHDIEPSTWREHKPLVYGFIDYPRLVKRLREMEYQGVMVFEIGGPAAEMPTYLKDAKRILQRLV